MSGQAENAPQENPPSAAVWTNDYFRDPALASGRRPVDRGLVGHVPIVASLLIVQGLLELLFTALGVGFTALVFFGPQQELGGMKGPAIMLLIIGSVCGAAGALRIVAGLMNLRYRRRVLGIVALAGGLVTMMSGYCAPSGIALAIYGLIVYINEPVVAAFALGDGGRPPAEIQAAFPRP
jgi:hypothetical protein